MSAEYCTRLERGDLSGVSDSVLHDQPAYVRNNRMNIRAADPPARALPCEVFEQTPAKTCRFVFLDPRATRLYPDWAGVARNGVGALRVEVAKNPFGELSNMIGELSTRSDAFRTQWGAHDVHVFAEGTQRLHHPAVGEMALVHENLGVPGDPGLSATVYSADSGTPAADALKLLAGWAAGQERDAAASQADTER
ncbi:transcriptional regulator [Streptomyces sp. NRRL S-1022]|uniref:MmyB family transcriptional regulator n=1 Tax=Streptomyces sp. NRRL S-1022 TaxID=1463880 RepID=UPI001F18695B|nr:transcriptional regulator [Streptomyces sp. NRRL S-1022]